MSTKNRSNRVSVRISAEIKRHIASGKLTAGERLPSEREMAARHKVSRVSVREAYKSLEELGVVTVRRGADGGAFIAAPDHAVIQDSFALMLRLGRMSADEISDAWMIQPAIARLAARHARPADVGRLRRVVAREEAAMDGRVSRPIHPAAFQRALAECSRNGPLAAIVNCLADMTFQTMPDLEFLRRMSPQVRRFHRSIVEAVERRDEEAAERLMREYVRVVLRRTSEFDTRQHRRTLPATSESRSASRAA